MGAAKLSSEMYFLFFILCWQWVVGKSYRFSAVTCKKTVMLESSLDVWNRVVDVPD